MKYRQMFIMTILAIFGLSGMCGCATLFSPKTKYPEVPEDYPFSVIWKQPKDKTAQIPLDTLNKLELLNLVMVKKWNEGDRDFVGADMSQNGKVYLHYPNVVYVQWEEDENPDGTISMVPTRLAGPGGDYSVIVDQVGNGILPPGVFVLDMESSGIDAYEYLKKR